jgi:predicted O-methyltransferase YrrM
VGKRRQIQSLLVAARFDPLGVVDDAKLARAALRHQAIQKVPELTPLIALVRRLRPQRVIEIGTAHGGTLYVWSRLAADDGRLVSIDWPDPSMPELPPEEQLRALVRPGQHLEIVRGDSHAEATRARVEQALGGEPADFLYIDGDHSYEGVRRDFEDYAPFVRPGGLVALHDVLRHRPETGCEVERFWQEVKGAHRHWEFTEPEHDLGFGQWGGIGVLQLAGT